MRWKTSLPVFLCVFVFCVSAQGGNSDFPPDAVWVAESGRLLQFSADDGSLLLEIPVDEDIRSVDIDPATESVWVGGPGTLRQYGFDGELWQQFPLDSSDVEGLAPISSECGPELFVDRFESLVPTDSPLQRPGGVLSVDSRHGDTWYAFGGRLAVLPFTASAPTEHELEQEVLAIAPGQGAGQRWVLTARQLFLMDWNLEELFVKELSATDCGRDVVFDPDTNSLWLLGQEALSRYDMDSTDLQWQLPIDDSPYVRLSPTGTWIASHSSLMHITASGEMDASFSHQQPGDLIDFAVAPKDADLWAVTQYPALEDRTTRDDRLIQLDQQGNILQSVSLSSVDQSTWPWALALYGYQPFPALSFESPPEGAAIDQTMPSFLLNYTEVGSPIELSTLVFQLNQEPVELSCALEDENAIACQTTVPLTVGDYHLQASIADADGRWSPPVVLAFSIVQSDAAEPVFESQPVTQAQVGTGYQYQVEAHDPDGGSLSYSLLQAPGAMEIGSVSGLIDWLPEPGDEGDHTVQVLASSSGGGQAAQSYVLTVAPRPNEPPVFTSQPLTEAIQDELYQYVAQAYDPDGDALLFELVTAPAGMTLDTYNGELSWLPGESDVGAHFVRLQVCDPFDACDEQTFTLVVLADESEDMSAEDYLDWADDYFDSDAPPTSPEEFEQSEFGQMQMDRAARARRIRDHALVMAAVDPDPDWFATELDRDIVVTQPGETHQVQARKVSMEGDDLGPVDPQLLRLTVLLQRDDNEYEWLPEVFSEDIVHWVGDDGVLEIAVPEDLERGRLVVGVRPDFLDPGQRAIAERWSTAITFEVWPLQPGVQGVSPQQVLFPLPGDDLIDPASVFEEEEILAALVDGLEEGDVVLPLVLDSSAPSVEVDQLLDYRVDGSPYGGRVYSVEVRDGQQMVLLIPEWMSVYDVTDAEDGFLADQGVLPESVIFRSGPPIEDFDAEYRGDLLHLDPEDGTENDEPLGSEYWPRTSGGNFFVPECKGSIDLVSLTFSQSLDWVPFSASMDVSVGIADGVEVECTWSANSNARGLNLLNATGAVGLVLRALAGTEMRVKPVGDIVLKTGHEGSIVGGFSGIDFGLSSNDGAYFNLNIPPAALGSSPLLGAPGKTFVELGQKAGAKGDFNLVGARGLIGRLIQQLGGSELNLGVELEALLGLGLRLEGVNPAAVYQDGDVSQATAAVSLGAKIKAANGVTNLVQRLGVNTELSAEIKTELEFFKAEGSFVAEDVLDDGMGNASVQKLEALPTLASWTRLGQAGLVSPEDQTSSVFSDRHSAVTYDIEECEESPGGRISSPIVACVGWMFCGMTSEVEFCGGDLWISPVAASANVGESVSTTGEVGVTGSATGGNSVVASVNGEPLVPVEGTVEIEPGTSREFTVSATCTSKGAHIGTINASSSEGLEAESPNKLKCNCQPGHSDCDRTWASPHLITADGLAYDYYASGDYILQRIPGVEGIEVQGRFLPGFGVSWPQAAAMQVGPDVVEVHGDRLLTNFGNSHLLHVWVNGQKVADVHEWQPYEQSRYVALPGGGGIYIDQFIRRFGGNRVDPIVLTVHWPHGGQTEGYGVQVAGLVFNQNEAAAYKNNPPIVEITLLRPETPPAPERGMLGTHDGDPSTDMTRRNGQVIEFSDNLTWTELYAMFGSDWLARPNECLFRNGCIVPEFPIAAVQLDPAQEAFARAACYGLSGRYYEACVHDVGLLGQADIVQALYANTDDLNDMADLIVQPGVDQPVFTLVAGDKEDVNESHYRQPFSIEHVTGDGGWLLTIRPPSGMDARLLSSGDGSASGPGDFADAVDVNGCQYDPFWLEAMDVMPELGALQLWARDPLSGGAGSLLGEIPLPQPEYCDFALTFYPDPIEILDGQVLEVTPGITEPVGEVVLDLHVGHQELINLNHSSVTVPDSQLEPSDQVLVQGDMLGETILTLGTHVAGIESIHIPVIVYDSSPPNVDFYLPHDIHIDQEVLVEVTGSGLFGAQVESDQPGLAISEVNNSENHELTFILRADESVPQGPRFFDITTPSGDAGIELTIHDRVPDELYSIPATLEVEVEQTLDFDLSLNRVYVDSDIELVLSVSDESVAKVDPQLAVIPLGSLTTEEPFVVHGECPGEVELKVVTDFAEIASLTVPITVSQSSGPEIGSFAPDALHIGAPMAFEIHGSNLCGVEVMTEHQGLSVLAVDSSANETTAFKLQADSSVPLGPQQITLSTPAGLAFIEVEVLHELPRLLMNLEVLALDEEEARIIELQFDQPHDTDLAIELSTEDPEVASIEPASLIIPAGATEPVEQVLLEAEGAGRTSLQINLVDYPQAAYLHRPVWVGRQTEPLSVESLTAGGYHACAILEDQSTACWGANWDGEAVFPDGEFIALSAGGSHVCGLRPDHRAVCWGWDGLGQSSPPAGQFSTISAGRRHTCALRFDGRAVCWGDDEREQSSPPDGEFVQIGSGWNHSCGLRQDGTVECWGRTRFGGQLATPPEGQFTALSVGLEHNCALRSDGSAECWGRNNNGQAVAPDEEFTSISAGGWHNCGIKLDGGPVCWGSDWAEQATLPDGEFVAFELGWEFSCGVRPDNSIDCWGWGDNGETNPPGEEFVDISAGGWHDCARRPDGIVKCWGADWDGQSSVPGENFLDFSTGNRHTCAVRMDGSADCWGRNTSGKSDPIDGQYFAISAGDRYTCALHVDGHAVCWGDDSSGQSSPPDNHFDFVAVASGYNHTCALRENGAVACWGDDSSGQASPPPGEFVAISVGWTHTCALRTDGGLVCWGDDDEGKSSPPAGEFAAVSAGSWHTCALRTDGRLRCWGGDWWDQSNPPQGEFTTLDAGIRDHTCALAIDGFLQCWGEFVSGGGPILADGLP